MDSRVTTSTTTPMTGCALIRILFVDDFSWRNDLVRGQYILIVVYSIFMVWDSVFFMSFFARRFSFSVLLARKRSVNTHTYRHSSKWSFFRFILKMLYSFLSLPFVCETIEKRISRCGATTSIVVKKASSPVALTMLRFSSFFHLVACVAVLIDHRSILEHLLFGSSATSPLRLLCLHKMKTESK